MQQNLFNKIKELSRKIHYKKPYKKHKWIHFYIQKDNIYIIFIFMIKISMYLNSMNMFKKFLIYLSMEIELVIQRKKEIYSSLIDFIDNAENADIDCIIEIFEKDSIIKDKEIIITLHLLSKISDNHHYLPDFIDKLEKIIQYLIQDKKAQIPDFKIYKIFKNNKRVLLMLLEQGFIQPDQQIIEDIMETKDENYFPYKHYLYSGIKSSIDEKDRKMIESEIKKKYTKEISSSF